MPFASKTQARWMFANRPRTARRWVTEAGGKVKIGQKRGKKAS